MSAWRQDIRGFSRGMYANWLWLRPQQLLIDAGEGLHLALGREVFAPAFVALTHGHSDHVLGLPGLLAARRFGKGARERPLRIAYPEQSRGVQAVREYLGTAFAGVVFPVTWEAVGDGTRLPLGKNLEIEAFAVRHVVGEAAVGYRVIETRRRLKAEYASLPRADVEALARSGRRDEMTQTYGHLVLAHSGDAMPIDPALAAGADLLVHDATFLDEADRREPIHATSEEAFGVARAAAAKTLVLTHLSVRYDRAQAVAALRAQAAASGFAGDAWLLDEASFIALTPSTGSGPRRD